MIEAYVPTSSLLSIARKKGVLAVVPSSPMVTNVGATTSQGVVQHRVDQLPAGVDGSGITVGVMSDSYDTIRGAEQCGGRHRHRRPAGPRQSHSATRSPSSSSRSPDGTDEGRAMLQIVHDLAPKARLGFATANGGEVDFANNIRALAGLPGRAATPCRGSRRTSSSTTSSISTSRSSRTASSRRQSTRSAAKGVSYFSSAGNRPATQAYDSEAAHRASVTPHRGPARTSNFTNVPPELYAGGFHNFDEGSGSTSRRRSIRHWQHACLPVE